MHAFMPAVLSRTPRLDALEVDPEAQPPDRELGQTEEGSATGKGGAVVGADTTGQPKVLKSALKHGKGIRLTGTLQGVAADQIAAGEVGDGQRIAISLIRQHELPLVVGTPKVVRTLGGVQGRSFGPI